MKNLYKIFADWKKSQIEILERHGIKVEQGYDSFWLEKEETYEQLKPYFDEWGVSETVVSKFSKEEEAQAKRLVLLSTWPNGYPMPDNDNGYKKTTYDDTEYCETCGVGLKQKEPFRLKTIPKWTGSQKKMFSLNWVFDELFIKSDFYESLFKPIGIESEKVLLYKKETVIDDTLQLIIPEATSYLDLENYPFQICKNCGRKRYDLINKGFFPSFKEELGEMPICKSREWFGTGANARKYIFVSAEMRLQLMKSKIDANYIPCYHL